MTKDERSRVQTEIPIIRIWITQHKRENVLEIICCSLKIVHDICPRQVFHLLPKTAFSEYTKTQTIYLLHMYCHVCVRNIYSHKIRHICQLLKGKHGGCMRIYVPHIVTDIKHVTEVLYTDDTDDATDTADVSFCLHSPPLAGQRIISAKYVNCTHFLTN